MTLENKIKTIIENQTGSGVKEASSVSGGCISNAYRITLTDGSSCFLKYNSSADNDMFIREAHGLKELFKPGVIKIPQVYGFDKNYILLEFVAGSNKQGNFSEDFGRKFAHMHKFTNKSYGFYEDNFIGSNPQINTTSGEESNNWVQFYFNKRIIFQIELAESLGNSTPELRKAVAALEWKIENIITDNGENPSLLHGDLWGGNYIVGNDGLACLIDPAVYYGNREADLAMTKLFGGFDKIFYSAYNEVYPFLPGYDYRENIYKLYHVLNHLNLFGGGYYSQALSLINYYL